MAFTPNTPQWPEERMDNIGRNGNDGEHYVPTQSVNAHYQRTYKGVLFDPYRIAAVWRMQGGPREQIMKKCLRFTEKGQTEQEVVNEIRSALNRWQEMLDEDKNNG